MITLFRNHMKSQSASWLDKKQAPLSSDLFSPWKLKLLTWCYSNKYSIAHCIFITNGFLYIYFSQKEMEDFHRRPKLNWYDINLWIGYLPWHFPYRPWYHPETFISDWGL